jgi:Fe-S-cluster containining protein
MHLVFQLSKIAYQTNLQYHRLAYRGDQLVTRHDGACAFLKGRQCSIHKAKPAMCRTYPFWQRALSSSIDWNAEAGRCEGITPVTVATEAPTSVIQDNANDVNQETSCSLPRLPSVDPTCSADVSYGRWMLPYAGTDKHPPKFSKEQVGVWHALGVIMLIFSSRAWLMHKPVM